MRSLTRLGILVESMSKFLRQLRRTYPELYQGLDPELWRKYVARTGDGGFALTLPSQSACRLLEAAADLKHPRQGVCRGFLPCFQDFLPTCQLLNIPLVLVHVIFNGFSSFLAMRQSSIQTIIYCTH